MYMFPVLVAVLKEEKKIILAWITACCQ